MKQYSGIFQRFDCSSVLIPHNRLENNLEEAEETVRRIRQEEGKFFKMLPGTNWTMFDIRRGRRVGRRELAGVMGPPPPPAPPCRPSTANRTALSPVLLYNRVPKCASTTVIALINLLAQRNNFRFQSSPIYWRWSSHCSQLGFFEPAQQD